MHAYVVGNIAVDETIALDDLPMRGASVLATVIGQDLGGKGANQAVILGRAGIETTLVAAIGLDERGATIKGYLKDEPLIGTLIQIPECSTDGSIIYVLPDGENAIVTTTASAELLGAEDAVFPMRNARAGDLLVVQGNLTLSTTLAVLMEAKRKGLTTALNPSPIRDYFFKLWAYIDIVFLNEFEALQLTGLQGGAAAAAMLSYSVEQVVLTLGKGGASLFSVHGTEHVEAAHCELVDSAGAGDTFMAVALASASKRTGLLDERALQDAALAAALTVSRSGTRAAFPTIEELSQILNV